MRTLSHREIGKLHKLAIELGLGEKRGALLEGIDRSFVGSITKAESPSAQLFTDLHRCNNARTLVDGSKPLLQWLENAYHLTPHCSDAKVFNATLLELDPHWRERDTRKVAPPPRPADPAPHTSFPRSDWYRLSRLNYRISRLVVVVVPITMIVLFSIAAWLVSGGLRGCTSEPPPPPTTLIVTAQADAGPLPSSSASPRLIPSVRPRPSSTASQQPVTPPSQDPPPPPLSRPPNHGPIARCAKDPVMGCKLISAGWTRETPCYTVGDWAYDCGLGRTQENESVNPCEPTSTKKYNDCTGK